MLQIFDVEAQDCGNWTLYEGKNHMPAHSFFTRAPGMDGYPRVCRIILNLGLNFYNHVS